LAETLNGVPVEVLGRSTVKLPDRRVTYIKIRPPAIPAQSVTPPLPPAAKPSPEEVLAELRREAKPQIQLGIGATVYAGSPTVTELSWQLPDGRRFRAFSSVDFHHLTQLGHLETETTVYGWFPFFYNGDSADLPSGVREALTANSSDPQYLFEGTEADAVASKSTLQALDYLHVYFELNKTAHRRYRPAPDRCCRAGEARRHQSLSAQGSNALFLEERTALFLAIIYSTRALGHSLH